MDHTPDSALPVGGFVWPAMPGSKRYVRLARSGSPVHYGQPVRARPRMYHRQSTQCNSEECNPEASS